MNYHEKVIDGLPIFELEGKITGGPACIALCDRLREVIASGQRNILLDFEKVCWLNSAGIGFMLSCVTSLRRAGGDMHFVGVHDKVAYYFKITKLDTVLNIYSKREEVIDRLRLSVL